LGFHDRYLRPSGEHDFQLTYAHADFGILRRQRLNAVHEDVGDNLKYFPGPAVDDDKIRKELREVQRFTGQGEN
jgi:hypothetical protein